VSKDGGEVYAYHSEVERDFGYKWSGGLDAERHIHPPFNI
jgi:hypothetical protein